MEEIELTTPRKPVDAFTSNLEIEEASTSSSDTTSKLLKSPNTNLEIEEASTRSSTDTTSKLLKSPNANLEIEEASTSRSPNSNLEIEEISITCDTPSKMEEPSRSQFCTKDIFKSKIVRAPALIRNNRQADFEPKLVSIGPYHHGQENLKQMEELKVSFMSDLIKKYDLSSELSGLVDHFKEYGEMMRQCYRETIDLSSYGFVQMLILDSFFIIHFVISVCGDQPDGGFLDSNIEEIRSDLLLLENQIPLCFLKNVFDYCVGPHLPPLHEILVSFLCLDLPWDPNERDNAYSAYHLLHLYGILSMSKVEGLGKHKLGLFSSANIYNRLFGHFRDPSSHIIGLSNCSLEERDGGKWKRFTVASGIFRPIPSATELHRKSGVVFQRIYITKRKNRTLIKKGQPNLKLKEGRNYNVGFHVRFEKGTLKLPYLKLDSARIKLVINLVTFEKSMDKERRVWTSYITLMDGLINTEEDVDFLQQCGIIHNTLSSNKMAATFFNDMGDICGAGYSTNLLDLFEDVQDYHDASWNQGCASLKHNYFNSPWSGISVVAGGTLLALTVLQTVYTVYGYYHPR